MLPALILWDMFLLSLELLAQPPGLAAVTVLIVVLSVVRAMVGRYWQFQIALLLSIVSAAVILSQYSTSAWGTGLMIYLMPSQIAIWGVWGVVSLAAIGFAARGRA
jgi:hypothetical protein